MADVVGKDRPGDVGGVGLGQQQAVVTICATVVVAYYVPSLGRALGDFGHVPGFFCEVVRVGLFFDSVFFFKYFIVDVAVV